jgi:ABC-2 type transport system ATP-binding protein
MSESGFAIETNGLTKQYGSLRAVDSLDLTVETGETYGFLGPNGAGKSTTIGLLLDYLRPTAGSARVLGRDPRDDVVTIHQRLGVLPDRFGLYEGRSARRHVAFVAETKGRDDDPERLLSRVGLGDTIETPVGEYSRGMEQRLALAMALVGEPELLVLDEPFTGLDPHGARRVREIVHEENERGATVFFSSHVLGQVELVCDRVGVLHDGRLVAEGTIDELRDRADLPTDASMEDVFVALTAARVEQEGESE